MSPREWAAVLAGLGDAERRDALLMLSDEDWLSQEGAAFLREAANRDVSLDPASDAVEGNYYWHHYVMESGRVIVNRRLVPQWALRRMPAFGPFSRDYSRADDAYAELLHALAAGAADGRVRERAPEGP